MQVGQLESRMVPWLGTTRQMNPQHSHSAGGLFDEFCYRKCLHAQILREIWQSHVNAGSIVLHLLFSSEWVYWPMYGLKWEYVYDSPNFLMVHAFLSQEDISWCVYILHEVILVSILSPFKNFIVTKMLQKFSSVSKLLYSKSLV